MTRSRLVLAGLLHYWRTNLAVLFGAVAATAVIGGALVVGDSVRDSLQAMSLVRLGKVDHALHGERFFREALADEIARQPGWSERFAAIAPALVMQGSLDRREAVGDIARAGRVNVYGVDARLWELIDRGDVAPPLENEAILNSRTAEALGASPGDEIVLRVELPESIPRESLFGERDAVSQAIALTVREILPDELGAARFGLDPQQQIPPLVFVPLPTLQKALDLAEERRRIPAERRIEVLPTRVNALFVQATPSGDAIAPETAAALNGLLQATWRLEDLGLNLRPIAQRNYLSLESERLILEDTFAAAGAQAAERLGVAHEPVLVYLANEITPTDSDPQDVERYSMYSIVAGVDLPPPAEFGPFENAGDPPELPLGPRDIILNDWLAEDLRVRPGELIALKYNRVGSHAEIIEDTAHFTVRGIVRLAGAADDRGFTPEVRDVTDVERYEDWKQPFPMKLGRVTDRDDRYWEERRATPKAFVSLTAARELWGTRHGSQTSLRIAPPPGRTAAEARDAIARELLATIDPQAIGMAFQPVKFRGLEAARGTTDFAGLFVGFSFFLILAATILIVLLFRLAVERRATQVGLLSAIGFTQAQVRRMFFAEGLLVVCAGGLLGTAAAAGYAALMVHGLRTWWIGAIGTRFLFVSVHWESLAIGFAIAVSVAAAGVWWALRQLRKIAPRDLLAGATEAPLAAGAQRRRGRRAGVVGAVSAILAGALLVAVLTGAIPNVEAFAGLSWQVVAFFLVGTMLLAASVAFLSSWLDSDRAPAVRGRGLTGLGRLGMRNTARNRQRSVFTVGLIAAATFVIVAVAAGRRNPVEERPDRNSGNGGFRLVAESSVPILHDLNTPAGQDSLGIRSAPGSDEARLLDAMEVVPFRVKPGEDASCLNIYRTRLPTILGVPQRMIDRGGFKFADTRAEEPWRLLERPGSAIKTPSPSKQQSTTGELQATADEEPAEPQQSSPSAPIATIPVLGDANTLQYSLHKGIGDTIAVPSDEAPEYVLEIVGMLDGSVFQGVLLMSEENFQRLYPDQSGYRYFLIGDKSGDGSQLSQHDAAEVARFLETGLASYGFDAEPVVVRLAAFLAVQNTYLSTFQTLGGLGLLLGTFGLATVMLRNVLERRGELALLRAVGFQNRRLGVLVLWENAFLLAWGLVAGTVSALLAMTPHLRSTGADVPWLSGGAILASVFAIGMIAALLAVREAVRTPILETLRSE